MKFFDRCLVVPGQDPWVVPMGRARYLLVQSINEAKIVGLEFYETKFVGEHMLWKPPKWPKRDKQSDHGKQLWAPEIHEFDNFGYVMYIAASDGNNSNHRIYALQSHSLTGPYVEIGKVCDTRNDFWAIDLTVFTYEGELYAIWSGWDGLGVEFPQNLYIAPMSDPFTISGERVLLRRPEHGWEMSYAPLLEGPQAHQHNGNLFVTYAADASWTPEYKTGVLVFLGGSPLDSSSWEKLPYPFLIGGGHGSFVTLNDQTLFVYHRKTTEDFGWGDRKICWASVEWDIRGLPVFKDIELVA